MSAQGVLADVSIATGYVTIALMLGGRFVFQWFGWQVAAATTPVLMLLRCAEHASLLVVHLWPLCQLIRLIQSDCTAAHASRAWQASATPLNEHLTTL